MGGQTAINEPVGPFKVVAFDGFKASRGTMAVSGPGFDHAVDRSGQRAVKGIHNIANR